MNLILAVIDPVTIMLILGSLYGGGSLLTQFLSGRGERGLMKEQLAFQSKQAKTGAEATKKSYKMQQAMSDKMWERLGTMKTEEKTEARKERFETGQQMSADRQLAMLLSAMQTMTQPDQSMGSMSRGIPSIPSLLR